MDLLERQNFEIYGTFLTSRQSWVSHSFHNLNLGLKNQPQLSRTVKVVERGGMFNYNIKSKAVTVITVFTIHILYSLK